MALELGRLGRLYAGLHNSYGDTPSPASTDALRHIMFLASGDPTNRRNSAEKQQSPLHHVRFDGRETAALRQLTALLRPSGTLNTLPEASELLEAAFGAKTNVTLSTTIASSPTTTSATLTSATGLAKHDFILITCDDGVQRARRLTSVNTGTGAVVWSPALDDAPTAGNAVKAGAKYHMTSGLALSLWFAHYGLKTDGSTAGFKRLLSGVAVERFSLNLDATEEAQFTISGPAKQLLTTVPSKPAAFTTVGSNPPPGWQTELYIGSTLQKFIKATIDVNTGVRLRNNEAGAGSSNAATEAYRAGRAEISLGLDCRVEDESVIYDNAGSGANLGVFFQIGFTEGNIIAIAMPQVEFKVPDTGDEDEEVNWPFRGMGLGSSDSELDGLFLALL